VPLIIINVGSILFIDIFRYDVQCSKIQMVMSPSASVCCFPIGTEIVLSSQVFLNNKEIKFHDHYFYIYLCLNY